MITRRFSRFDKLQPIVLVILFVLRNLTEGKLKIGLLLTFTASDKNQTNFHLISFCVEV